VKAGAYQVTQNITNGVINISQIPASILRPWVFGSCLISGNITNTITVDGKQQTSPVCHARVHLVEVEIELPILKVPILIKQIPDWVINEIAQKIISLKQNLPVVTPPIPTPPGGVGPISGAQKINFPLRQLGLTGTQEEALKLHALPTLPDNVMKVFASKSTAQIKQAITDNHALLYPYICLWPVYWPWFYNTDEDNIVYTDCNGHFELWENTIIEDGPLNIYTWVEAMDVNGNWITVYRPPLPCNTRWNYACGSAININLQNVNIPPCHCGATNVANESVWVKRVGDGTSIRNNMALIPNAPSQFSDARGLANNVIGSGFISPFTYAFPIWVLFGNPGTATHYRWKYRQAAIPNGTGLTDIASGYTYQDGPLSKTYQFFGADLHWHSAEFKLNEIVGGKTLYKIPHPDAKDDVGVGNYYLTLDTASVAINASGMADGLYEYVLELYDNAGNVVSNLPSSVFQLDAVNPANSDFADSILTSPAHYDYITGTPGHVNALRFLIRVDNNVTSCGISDAMVQNANGTSATTDTQCGFAKYQSQPVPGDPNGKKQAVPGDKMLMRFYAHQPHSFGEFVFNVYKGNAGVVFSGSGQVPEPSHTVVIGGNPVAYQYNPDLATLLGSCDKAAFSENLYVYAYHTNGSTRIQAYDSSGVAAFAVEPQ